MLSLLAILLTLFPSSFRSRPILNLTLFNLDSTLLAIPRGDPTTPSSQQRIRVDLLRPQPNDNSSNSLVHGSLEVECGKDVVIRPHQSAIHSLPSPTSSSFSKYTYHGTHPRQVIGGGRSLSPTLRTFSWTRGLLRLHSISTLVLVPQQRYEDDNCHTLGNQLLSRPLASRLHGPGDLGRVLGDIANISSEVTARTALNRSFRLFNLIHDNI